MVLFPTEDDDGSEPSGPTQTCPACRSQAVKTPLFHMEWYMRCPTCKEDVDYIAKNLDKFKKEEPSYTHIHEEIYIDDFVEITDDTYWEIKSGALLLNKYYKVKDKEVGNDGYTVFVIEDENGRNCYLPRTILKKSSGYKFTLPQGWTIWKGMP